MVPALGLEFNQEWEDKIVLELDTTFRANVSKADCVKIANVHMGMPKCCGCIIGGFVKSTLGKAAQKSIATGKGYKVSDEVAIAKDFKLQMGSNPFFGGESPGTIDISMFGFLAPPLWAKTDWAENFISGGGLEDWRKNMEAKLPPESLFAK